MQWPSPPEVRGIVSATIGSNLAYAAGWVVPSWGTFWTVLLLCILASAGDWVARDPR